MHTSGNSSIDTSLIRDIYCGPEVLFETRVAMKFVDDDDDNDIPVHSQYSTVVQNSARFMGETGESLSKCLTQLV